MKKQVIFLKNHGLDLVELLGQIWLNFLLGMFLYTKCMKIQIQCHFHPAVLITALIK